MMVLLGNCVQFLDTLVQDLDYNYLIGLVPADEVEVEADRGGNAGAQPSLKSSKRSNFARLARRGFCWVSRVAI